MSDEMIFYPLAEGIYRPYNDDTVVFINPAEVLFAKGLPVTQEMMLAFFAAASAEFQKEGTEAILIESMDTPAMADHIKTVLQNRSNNDDES